jgi:RHS repeat-associated protein
MTKFNINGTVVQNTISTKYVLRDHLGNTRVTFRDGTNKGTYFDWNTWSYKNLDPHYDDGIVTKDDIVQINHYYPFGLNMEGDWNGAQGNNKYQYNGKEWNDDFGLGWNDYGARFYDPAIGRWLVVDPLAEKMRRHSPYNYCFNNPIRFLDPNGMAPEINDVPRPLSVGETIENAFSPGQLVKPTNEMLSAHGMKVDSDMQGYLVSEAGENTDAVGLSRTHSTGFLSEETVTITVETIITEVTKAYSDEKVSTETKQSGSNKNTTGTKNNATVEVSGEGSIGIGKAGGKTSGGHEKTKGNENSQGKDATKKVDGGHQHRYKVNGSVNITVTVQKGNKSTSQTRSVPFKGAFFLNNAPARLPSKTLMLGSSSPKQK